MISLPFLQNGKKLREKSFVFAVLPVVDRPAHHPHAVIRERSDREAGDQCERIKGGDKHLAEPLIPLIV